MRITCLLFSIFILFSFSKGDKVKTKKIKGEITSNNIPLQEVSVVLEGTKYFAITDKKGKFELEVPKYLWDEEIFIIFNCKDYEENLVQFQTKTHFKKKLKVQMESKFENAKKNYVNPDDDVMEYNNIIQSEDVSEEED